MVINLRIKSMLSLINNRAVFVTFNSIHRAKSFSGKSIPFNRNSKDAQFIQVY